MTEEAVNKWFNDYKMADVKFGIPRSPLNPEHLLTEWLEEPFSKGYVATITHTMGTADYAFKKLADGTIEILVTNRTSVGSATGANANVNVPGTNININPLGLNGKYERPKGFGAQPFTNVYQTIRMVKTVDELKALIKN